MRTLLIMRHQAQPEDHPIFYSEPFPSFEDAEAHQREVELVFPIDYEIWCVEVTKLKNCPSCGRPTYVDEDSGNRRRHVHDDLPIAGLAL